MKVAVGIFTALVLSASQPALAVCGFDDKALQLDPVEVGYCESDAVFVAKVSQVVESMRGFTADGSARTDHYHTQYTTLRVIESFKGSPPEKVTTIADLKTPESAYAFESEKTYLVFAKKLSEGNEYSAFGACSIQPTVPIQKAKSALSKLRRNKTGGDKIDCNNIRPKEDGPRRN